MSDGPQPGRRRVTLEHVAAQAQVSRALVSLVMRDEPGPSAETRARVLETARQLGYRPDARARSLAGQSARLIGVVFGVAATFHFDLLDGLYEAAEDRHYDLLLSALTRGRDEAKALESLHDFRFDGLVMLGPPVADPREAGLVPVVVVGWHVDHPEVDIVRTSDDTGMRLAVAHLVEYGHRRIAHIDGGPGLTADARRRGYLDAMAAHGLAAHARILTGGQTQLDGQRAARTLLAEGDLPTALIAYNDDIAVAAIGLLAHEGIDVPREMSVIGWDDTEMAGLSHVDLTSVAQQPHEMARRAVERIVERCAGRFVDNREIILEPTLTVRSSTTRPASAS